LVESLILRSFNNTVSIAENKKCQMRLKDGHKWSVDKDLEEGGHGLFQGIIPPFTWIN